MERTPNALSLVLTALLGFIIFTGCSRTTPVEQATHDQVLLRANGADPSSLDPHLATGVTEHNIIAALLEGLMRPTAKDLSPKPGMAERYDLSPDGTVYTFFLRENAVWSNGDPVTAHDFVFSFQRILEPEFGGEYAYMLHCMHNAEAFNKGKIKNFSEVGAKALDDKTLQITLKAPTPYFLSLIQHYSWFPLHPPTLLKHGTMTQRNTRWTRPGHFVGNGPFNLKHWKIHDSLVVTKSASYYDAAKVKLNGIHFFPIDNINTEERAFRARQVHMTNSIPLNKIEAYKKDHAPELRLSTYLGTYYYMLNVEKKPLDNVKVRQALSLSIDRKSITKNILKGGQQPATCFTPFNTAGYTSRTQLKEDIQKAKSLLAEAGFPHGQNFPNMELLYNSSESHKVIAEAIQQMWKKHLNIEVTLNNQDWKVYLVTRKNKDYEIGRAGWIGDYNDPSTFLELLTSNSGNNNTHWKNKQYDELVAQAAITGDQAERYELFQQAEAILLEELPIIPIYFYISAYLVDPVVQGWHNNILDWHPYQDVFLQQTPEGASNSEQ